MPAVGKFILTLNKSEVEEFVHASPTHKLPGLSGYTYVKTFFYEDAPDNWLPVSQEANYWLEKCPQEHRRAFQNFNVWVPQHGQWTDDEGRTHTHPVWDPAANDDYCAMALGMMAWYAWQKEVVPTETSFGWHGRFPEMCLILIRAQAYYLGHVNFYETVKAFNERSCGPNVDEAAWRAKLRLCTWETWPYPEKWIVPFPGDALAQPPQVDESDGDMAPSDDDSSTRDAEEAEAACAAELQAALAKKEAAAAKEAVALKVKAKAVSKLASAVRKTREARAARREKRAAGRKRHREERIRDPDYAEECAPTPVDRVRKYAIYVLRIRIKEGFDGLDAATFNSHRLARLKLGVTSWGALSRAQKLSNMMLVLDVLHEFEVEKPPDLDDKKMWHWMLDLECDYLQATEQYKNDAFEGRECREMPDADVLDICSAAFKKSLACNRRQ